nr:precorrin-6A/cobalt-precorrin-6A reductase [uncultured Methanobrevibacter sp.]
MECKVLFLTKDSGNVGGFLEKTDAAKECGMEVVVLSRLVNEEGISVEEAKDTIRSNAYEGNQYYWNGDE